MENRRVFLYELLDHRSKLGQDGPALLAGSILCGCEKWCFSTVSQTRMAEGGRKKAVLRSLQRKYETAR